MSSLIDNQISSLHKEVVLMGNLCENAIEKASKALLDYDIESAHEAVALEEEINKKERDIEEVCLTFLLKHHPVAKDLRKISATLKMLTDLERIGDQARDIAEIVLNNDLSDYKNISHIQALADATTKMVTDIIDAYVKSDITICENVIKYDNVVDDLFDEMKADIINIVKENMHEVENAIFLLMIAKYFERIGDHATNIAEWVEFSITGIHRRED